MTWPLTMKVEPSFAVDGALAVMLQLGCGVGFGVGLGEARTTSKDPPPDLVIPP